jgi:2-polyprenyl-6-hydroxyphenyl methylase/3-demethylubiquinone-9 3-methyltransferase
MAKDRFAFGANWLHFLEKLDEVRISEAESSICAMLQCSSLQGKRFLDIGCGSGLFSLVARRLGAEVVSFDYDPQSVACTTEVKRRYRPDDDAWTVMQGSALDPEFLNSLGHFDVVYSWGVLHHTGQMWFGIDLASERVSPGGHLYIAIYNDQGWKSRVWWLIKWFYNLLPKPLNLVYGYAFGLSVQCASILLFTLQLRPMEAIRPLLNYKKKRGMSVMTDMIDWMGGFPFQFASYSAIESYVSHRNFRLVAGRRNTSLGCHEQVFQRG